MKLTLPKDLSAIGQWFAERHVPLYAVGGWVRDRISGRPVYDLDAASPAPPETVLALCAAGDPVKVTARDAGLASLTLTWQGDEGEISAEFTSFRKESYRNDGSHRPIGITAGATLTEDALRRDFTVNAIYADLADGTVLDPLNGQADLARQVLRTTRKSDDVFAEDGLRLLRLARFAAELGFAVEEETLAGAKRQAAAVDPLVPARVGQEMERILLSDRRNPADGRDAVRKGLDLLQETGILERLFPGADAEAPARVKDDPALRFAALMKGMTADAVREKLMTLGLGKALAAEASALAEHRGTVPEDAALFLARQGSRAEKLLDLWTADDLDRTDERTVYEQMKKDGIPLAAEQLALNGRQIAEILGEAPGPHIGQVRQALWEAAIQRRTANTPEALTQYIRETILK